MSRGPLILIVVGLALHFPGWLWHDMFHSHEGLETLQTQAVFYVATATILAGALVGLLRSIEPRLRWSYAIVLGGAVFEMGGWAWDFAAHYAGGSSGAAHMTVFIGSAIAVLGALTTTVVRARGFHA